ncbi:MAG: LytTR family DNA-binding domain-containing protein [Bacteroidota bacterium]
MSTYKCLIIDDEPLARNVLKKYIENLEAYELQAEASDAFEAIEILEKNAIDLIFLDINMPELSGIDFIKSLDYRPSVIITSAYREYAAEGFELDVIDYLVKPITFPRFLNALNKFKRLKPDVGSEESTAHEHDEDSFIFIKVDKRMVKVLFHEILYVESLKDYVRVVTETEQLITHSNLSNFTDLLPKDRFIRVHKSFTISLSKVKAIEGNLIEVSNSGHRIPIGRVYQQEVKSAILKKD